MGCISSKLRPEDSLGRCKARKRMMKEAVDQRLAFAEAYAAYLLALRNTGAALRQFAEEEGGMPACAGLQLGPFAGPIPEPPPPPPLHVEPSCAATHDSASPCFIAYEPFLRSPGPCVGPADRSLLLLEECSPMKASSTKMEVEHFRAGRMSAGVMTNEAGVDPTNTAHITDASTLTQHQDSFATVKMSEKITTDAAIINPTLEKVDHDEQDVGNLQHELSLMLKLNAKKDLAQIVREIDEEFLKASAGGTDAVRTLETCIKPQVAHTGFYSKARNYKSARVFSAFSWNWSRNPLISNRAEMGTKHMDENQQKASHALTLERLLAWEKKLFEEVKVVEALRAEQAKKCSILRHQETRGENAADIEKTRAELKRLHSLILVCNNGVDSTIEAIEDLRDEDLHPQLLELIDGLMNMWMTMHQSHARQAQIIVHIKNIDAMMSQQATSESHHQTTIQLEKELLCWHHTFCKLVASQRGYVSALYGWIKLSLIPIPTDKVKITANDDGDDNNQESENLETYRLCEEWQRALGCLPDRVASEAIKSLAEVVKAMVAKQAEEMKQKKKTEKLEKLLEKKVRALQPLEEEEEAAAVEEGRSRWRRSWREEGGDEKEGKDIERRDVGVLERKAAVAAMRKRLEGEMIKHGKAVQDTRMLTMNNLQTGLPGVLEAMTGFSAVCAQAFQHLHYLTAPQYSCYTCYS